MYLTLALFPHRGLRTESRLAAVNASDPEVTLGRESRESTEGISSKDYYIVVINW